MCLSPSYKHTPHTHTHTLSLTHSLTDSPTHMHTSTHTQTHTHTHTQTHTHALFHSLTHSQTHLYICMYTHTHTHAHTCIHWCRCWARVWLVPLRTLAIRRLLKLKSSFECLIDSSTVWIFAISLNGKVNWSLTSDPTQAQMIVDKSKKYCFYFLVANELPIYYSG